jgi:hypothetical protein
MPVNADRTKQTRCSEQFSHAGGAGVQVSVIKAVPRHRRNPNQAGQISHDLGRSSNDQVAQP